MIILFTYKDTWMSYMYYLIQRVKQLKFKILHKFNKKLFDKAEVIIPFGIHSQTELNNYSEYKHKFLVNKNYVYNILDDKKNFYNFIKKYNLLNNTNIHLIKTYTKSNLYCNKYGQFLIKDTLGIGSNYNHIESGYLHNLIRKYSKNYQIQDIIDGQYIDAINCLCKDGKIIRSLNFQAKHKKIKNKFELLDQQYFCETDSKFLKVIENIVEKLNYSGFIEFEFITDSTKQKIYLMECNPRISGNLLCDMKNTFCPFIAELIIPYIYLIQNKQYNTKTYDITPILYNSDIIMCDYKLCNCGCVKLS